MSKKRVRQRPTPPDRRPASEIPPDELFRRVEQIRREYSSHMRADIHPWIEMPPMKDIDAVTEFDRQTCERGITKYRRRLDPSEVEDAIRAGAIQSADRSQYVIVVEAAPGCRCRMYVSEEPRSHDQRRKREK